MSAIIRAANPSNRRKLDTNSSVAPKKAVKTGRLSFICDCHDAGVRRVLRNSILLSRHGMPRPRRRAPKANALRARRRRRHRARQRSGQPPRAARPPPSAPGPPRATRALGCSSCAAHSAIASPRPPSPISRRARRVRMLGAARTSTRAPIGRRLVRTTTSHHHCSRISTIVQPVREAWGRVQPLVRCGNGGGRRRRHVGPFGRELEFIATLSRSLL